MVKSRVQVEGASRLRRTLRRAGSDLSDFAAVHRAVSAVVIARADSTAVRRSGRLASTTRSGNAKAQSVVRVGSARVPYAGPIHWGWPKRNIEARPWVVDAAHDTEPEWTELYLSRIEEVLAQVKGE